MPASPIELKNPLPDLDLYPGRRESSACQWFSPLSHRGRRRRFGKVIAKIKWCSFFLHHSHSRRVMVIKMSNDDVRNECGTCLWILKDADVTNTFVVNTTQISDAGEQFTRVEESRTGVECVLIVISQLYLTVYQLTTACVTRRTCYRPPRRTCPLPRSANISCLRRERLSPLRCWYDRHHRGHSSRLRRH